MTPWCVPLDSVSRTDLPIAGGKGANLGELLRAGFSVPDGFVVTTEAYRSATAALAAPSRMAVAAIEVPAAVVSSIRTAYERLGAGPVAVRSSATAEDLPGAAFAGQQDTYLGVVGAQAVIDAVRDCWASLWSERAIAYRARLDIPEDAVAIAVVVQRMVAADWAGVMFTADPVTGDRDLVVIDSSVGLGESVVSGSVTPDHAVVAPNGRIVSRRPGRYESIVRALDGGGTETIEGGADIAPLAEAVLVRVAETGRRIASHFGSPQDIEWALTGADLHITQARPMTALPPAPVPLSRVQRMVGAVLNELLPRRPFPMELTVWSVPVVLAHARRMLDEIVGVTIDGSAELPTEDGIVQSFVPPRPRPSARTPVRLVRSLWRSVRHRAADWQRDPLTVAIRGEAAALSALDVRAASWAELLAVPARARRVTDEIADLRAIYLPSTGRSILLLKVLLKVLGRDDTISGLVGGADTQTLQANRALSSLADTVQLEPTLRHAFETMSADELTAFVAVDPSAAALRVELDAFTARFGHRETTGLMMVRDPTWGESPAIVLGLVQVMLSTSDAGGTVSGRGLELAARLDRATPTPTAASAPIAAHPPDPAALPAWLDGLVRTARDGTGFREDTHFELTRVMPVMRRTITELGARLADTGAIGRADDVWFLLWSEVAALPDPATGAHDDRLRAAVDRRKSAYAALASAPLIATATLYPRPPSVDGVLLTGVAGGSGRATGAVRIIRRPDEFARLRAGEVLVCPATNPSWTPLFTRAAALVVDNGGTASHAAIVAREYHLPAVLGVSTGTTTLVDGQCVTVDGDHGLVLPAAGVDAAR